MIHPVYETRMLTRFIHTLYSFQEVYTVTMYYSDGSFSEKEEFGLMHFTRCINFY